MIEIKNYNSIDEIKIEEEDNYIVFITEDYILKLENIREKFKNRTFYGAVVPYIITNKSIFYSSIAVIKLKKEKSLFKLLNMKEISNDEKKFLENINSKSILLFVDGLSRYFEKLVNNLNDSLNKRVKVIGAGLGYKDFSHKFTIFDYKDHSLIIGIDQNIRMGFSHGWKPII